MVVKRADDDPLVQYNVRVPASLRDRADARRRQLGISRDEWTRRVIAYALAQPPPSAATRVGRSLRRTR